MEESIENSRQKKESGHRNPIEKNRRTTDILYIVVLLFYFIIWLLIGFLGSLSNQKSDADPKGKIRSFINAPVKEFSAMLLLSIFLCLPAVLICLYLYKKITKIFMYIGVILYMLGIISYCINLSINLIFPTDLSRRDDWNFYITIGMPLIVIILLQILCNLSFLIYKVTSVVSFFEADKSILCEITKDSCRFMLQRPLILLFTVLIAIPGFLVLLLTLNASIYITGAIIGYDSTLRETVSLTDSLRWLVAYLIFCISTSVILFGGISALCFIFNFANMVISESAISYFWAKDEKIPIGRSAVKVLRNHIGTIMFASTIFVPLIYSIVQAFKHKRSKNNKENFIFYFMSKYSLVINISETALIFSMIYGTNFVKSSQKAFDAVLRHSSLYLAMLMVIDAVIATSIVILSVMITIQLLVFHKISEYDMKNVVLVIFYVLCYTLLALIVMISSTMKALLINKIIILNKEDDGAEGETEILNRL